MTVRERTILVAVMAVVTTTIFVAVYLNLPTPQPGQPDPVEHRVINLQRDLARLQADERWDRYLLCEIAGTSPIDGLPQPCLDQHGQPLIHAAP